MRQKTLMATSITIDLRHLPHVTNESFYPLHRCRSRFLVLMGGAGSGKSVFAAQKKLIRCMREAGHNIVAFRKVGATLRDSVFALLREQIARLGVARLWDVNKTELSLTFTPNGSRIRCMGLDDPDKLKSLWSLTSAWLEEATEFTPRDLEQINLRLRGACPSYRQIVVSFNPISHLHWLKKRFYDTAPSNTTTHHSTYRDNRFIDADYRRELEELAARDPQYAAVYARGEWGVLEGVIYGVFPNGVSLHSHERIYGLDFGYNHPMALIEFDLEDGAAYARERLYETGMTTSGLIAWMGENGISRDDPIYADSANPDKIEEIFNAGYNIHPATKGPGSVAAGISFCQGYPIFTLPENENFNAELATYQWRVDKNGNRLDEPEKANDHAMDAMRYALHTHLARDVELAAAGGQDVYPT